MIRLMCLTMCVVLALATAGIWVRYRSSCTWRRWDCWKVTTHSGSGGISITRGRVVLNYAEPLPGSGPGGMSVASGGRRHAFSGFVVEKSAPGLQINGSRWILVVVPLWAPLAVFAAWPTLWGVRRSLRSWLRRRASLCTKCAYDLTGNLSGVCPECGKPIVVNVRESAPKVT